MPAEENGCRHTFLGAWTFNDGAVIRRASPLNLGYSYIGRGWARTKSNRASVIVGGVAYACFVVQRRIMRS